MNLTSISPFNLNQNINPVHETSFSSPSGILLHHIDGRNEVITKSPAYVLGETILRPAIRAGGNMISSFVGVAKRSLNFLDSRISNLFTLIPLVSAGKTDLVEIVPMNKFLEALGERDKAAKMDTFIAKLEPEKRLEIAQNLQLQRNHLAYFDARNELRDFIVNEAIGFNLYSQNTQLLCKNWIILNSSLKEIVNDLENNGIKSQYSPFKINERTLSLTLPKYKFSTNSYSPYQFKDITEAKGYYESIRKEIEKQITFGGFSDTYDADLEQECPANYIADLLVSLLTEYSVLLQVYDVKEDMNTDQFKALFKDQTVANYREALDGIKKLLKQNAKTAKDVVNYYLRPRINGLRDQVVTSIHQIYTEQKKIAEKEAYIIKITSITKTNQAVGWIIEGASYDYYNYLKFQTLGLLLDTNNPTDKNNDEL